jgi:Methyltransferase FkbM domain
MNGLRINYLAPVTRQLVGRGLFGDEPFVLVDVGCSGGIAEHWRQFEPALRAFGFDPLVRECERLNKLERNPGVRYFDRFVGWEGYRDLFADDVRRDAVLGWSNQPFPRSSAARAQAAQAASYVQTQFNYGNPELKYTEQRTSLDAFFAGIPGVAVDFIKVDTDGHDYEVLCGSRELLTKHAVLGLLVETQFHGISHPHSNLFSNIDRLLREHGFSLFDLDTHRYTRAELPGLFMYDLAAQTDEGQILAADALYLRDLGAPGYEQRWGALADSKVLKLACLFELFGLADCAAEVLRMKRQQLRHVDVSELLDTLAGEVHPGLPSFAEVNRRFDSNPRWFYPRSLKERLRRALPRGVKNALRPLWRRYFR